ncbi:MAG TPA: hypothetical protein VI461_06995 [Chitinophagaceae bacterium]|nr:hypothetical protein [Chitinophagaceae bacterium]
MRKLSAILLIGLFTFSQYARQLSYLECKLSNVFKPNLSKCDCDKKISLVSQDSNPSPASKVQTHIHLDEFFSIAGEVDINSFAKSLAKAACLNGDDECEGNILRLWRPPNS